MSAALWTRTGFQKCLALTLTATGGMRALWMLVEVATARSPLFLTGMMEAVRLRACLHCEVFDH